MKKHALAIFELLAKAEATVHGVEAESVTFHEVGAVDSIVDIVAAAQLISLIRADRWTSAPLPIGSGRINTAHGVLPAPAPAAALLLQGLPVIDDGVPGERVTPTGAALAATSSTQTRHGRAHSLDVAQRHWIWRANSAGHQQLSAGVGVRRSDGEHATVAGPIGRRQLAVITFEVDDQCPEDLAAGLDHIRAMHGFST